MCLLLMEKYTLCFSCVRGKPINIEPFINTIQFLDKFQTKDMYFMYEVKDLKDYPGLEGKFLKIMWIPIKNFYRP